ncbi:MAG: alanine:cation symporter family protein [Dehalobacterium sp.]
MIGTAIAYGIRCGVYSNEAGMGSGTPAAAAADVSHPVKQGLIQAGSIYVDTLLVCSATAFIVLVTGYYNVMGPDGATMIVENLGVDAGASFAQMAVSTVFPFGKRRKASAVQPQSASEVPHKNKNQLEV